MKKRPCDPAANQEGAVSLLALLLEEIKKAEKLNNAAALKDWLELGHSMPSLAYEEKFTPEAAASVMNSCILFCDVIVAGKDVAAGLKYSEENMFAPMVVFLEKEKAADALVWAGENLGVPVVKNNNLAAKLVSYGKPGESIPDAFYADVSLVFSRLGPPLPPGRMRRQFRGSRKNGRGIQIKVPRPLSVEMGEVLFNLTGEEPGREKLLAEPLNAARKKLKRLLGFTVPPFRTFQNSRLRGDEYRILFRGIEAGRGRIDLSWYSGAQAAVIPDMMNNPENLSAAAKAVSAVIIRHVNIIIKKRAPELLGREEVEALLDAAEEKFPVVTGEVKSLLSLGIIREILQSLVSEQVSIRHIAVILETLADWGSYGPAPSEVIIEQIRQSLKRQICLEYADDKMTLRVLTLEPNLENKFADLFPVFGFYVEKAGPAGGDQKNSDPWAAEQRFSEQRITGQRPAEQKQADQRQAEQISAGQKSPEPRFSEPCSDDWADLISSAVHGMEEKGYPPVILCSPKARFPLKEATRSKIPDLAVLSYLEIPSDISVEPLGEIRLEGNVRLPG